MQHLALCVGTLSSAYPVPLPTACCFQQDPRRSQDSEMFAQGLQHSPRSCSSLTHHIVSCIWVFQGTLQWFMALQRPSECNPANSCHNPNCSFSHLLLILWATKVGTADSTLLPLVSELPSVLTVSSPSPAGGHCVRAVTVAVAGVGGWHSHNSCSRADAHFPGCRSWPIKICRVAPGGKCNLVFTGCQHLALLLFTATFVIASAGSASPWARLIREHCCIPCCSEQPPLISLWTLVELE